MLRRLFTLALLLCTVALYGCDETLVDPDDVLPGGLPPTVGNTTDRFSFTVTAEALVFEEIYTLTFTGEASTIGLSVVGYAGGEATLQLLDESGTVFYARNLAQNLAEGAETVPGRPATAVLRFVDYTGIVSVGVRGAS